MLIHVLSTVNKVGRDCYERCYTEIEQEVLSKNKSRNSSQSNSNTDPLDISSFAGRRSYDRYAMKIMTMAFDEQERLKKAAQEQIEKEQQETTEDTRNIEPQEKEAEENN